MREKDRQVLLKIAFEMYERKWAKVIYPEVISPHAEYDNDDLEGNEDASQDLSNEVLQTVRFKDIPWPIFTFSSTLVEFLQNAHEIPSFLSHPSLKKNLEGVENLLDFQRRMWHPRKIESRIMRKVVDEDKEDVYKAYLKVKEVLWEQLGGTQR